MAGIFDSRLEARLLRYAAIDSQSDETSATTPSTDRQLVLLRLLAAELTAMGAADVQLTPYGVVLASIPATARGPTIGFLAHVDTAPAFNATGVKPVVHRGYDGGDIHFADAPGLVLSPAGFPYLATKAGCDIITASGTTLLGADDKAGVAILMVMAEHLLAHPELPHGRIRLAFTPDEEIGRGVTAPLPADLAVDFAYTLDGSEQGIIEYESFSADRAHVTIAGVSTHPGDAKDQLVNALHLAARIVALLDQPGMTPETVSGRQGFIHAYQMSGTAAAAEISLILRDFERDGLAAKGDLVETACRAVGLAEPRARIGCTVTAQYRNMRYWLEQDMRPVDLAYAAARAMGIEPRSQAIRGGTDGSRLTEMGVPCPNIFTGMQNIHGPLEWIAVQDMAAATRVCLKLVELAAE